MLVITRREGEEVVIGDPAKPLGTIKVVSIKGDHIRLAFGFPRDVEVHRKEVAEVILRDGRAEGPGVIGSIRPTADGPG